ncbi:MAG: hypothetical protein K2U26_11965 [Cyclobacteriaceae bacterium]|nr:hypothetical protein [Cyclobacteriaceae bacterium]
MKTSYVFTILIVLCSCGSNNELEIRNNVSNDVKVNSDLVKAFDYLNEKIGDGDLSIENQIKVFNDYATSRKLGLNLNNASCSPKSKEASLPGVSKAHERLISDDMNMLNFYFINYGPGPEALSLIKSYKSKLGQGIYMTLDKMELDVLKEHVAALEFLAGTSVGRTYFENISAFANKQSRRETIQLRTSASDAECIFYITMIGYYSYACISTPWPLNLIPCGLLAYYAVKAAGCPGSGGSGGGCAGSSDPCCGITCITGYVCNGGQCEQDPNFVPPSCPEGCVWGGTSCNCP